MNSLSPHTAPPPKPQLVFFASFRWLAAVSHRELTSTQARQNHYWAGVSTPLSNWNTPYTFSGKEKDEETGYSYFGARYYDSDLSIWLSVDPLSDMYPSTSPFMYVRGNPVMLVDPDGRRIIIKGSSSFNRSIYGTMLGLAVKSKSGREMLIKLIKSETQLNIVETKGETGVIGSGNGTTLNWNLNDKSTFLAAKDGNGKSSIEKNSLTTLAHELKHAYDRMNNEFGFWFKSKDFKEVSFEGTYGREYEIISGTTFLSGEFGAVDLENKVRSELDMELRTHYDGVDVFNKTAVNNGKNGSTKSLGRDYKSFKLNNTTINAKDFQDQLKIRVTESQTEISQ